MKRNKHTTPEETPKDLGFGVRVSRQHTRILNADGSYNLQRRGVNRFQSMGIYHKLISMSWMKFNLMVVGFFVICNMLFACIYLALGKSSLSGMVYNSAWEKFWEAFFFSAQTLTTVGYGRINPVGFGASFVAAVESLLGLLGFALATGLLYGRFSRPVARIMYSENAVVAPYRDMNGLMFRIANERENQLIEVEVQVVLSMVVLEGEREIRRFFSLELERNKVNFFPTTWTIVHPIDEKSPMWGLAEKDFIRRDPEFLIMIKAFDDIFSSTVHARRSYASGDLLWGHKFTNIHEFSTSGASIIHLDRLGETLPADLNRAADNSQQPGKATL